MDDYIKQLVSDIHKATWSFRPPHAIWAESEANPDDELELEDMSFIEQYIQGNTEKISAITGIQTEWLPSPSLLNNTQQALLANELEKLLEFFHFKLEFPETLPAHLRYPYILDIWDEEYVPLSFGTCHIEFCGHEEGSCAFPDYCTTCKEVEAQMKFDEEQAKGHDTDFDLEPDQLLPSAAEIKAWMKQRDTEKENHDKEEEVIPETPFYWGFYDDAGNRIDPDLVPIPALCLHCIHYPTTDSEENLLCQMNRNDQKGAVEFKCGAFTRRKT